MAVTVGLTIDFFVKLDKSGKPLAQSGATAVLADIAEGSTDDVFGTPNVSYAEESQPEQTHEPEQNDTAEPESEAETRTAD